MRVPIYQYLALGWLKLKVFITVFALASFHWQPNFPQQSFRNLVKLWLNILIKFVEETLLHPKVRSTTIPSIFWQLCDQKQHEKSCWLESFFPSTFRVLTMTGTSDGRHWPYILCTHKTSGINVTVNTLQSVTLQGHFFDNINIFFCCFHLIFIVMWETKHSKEICIARPHTVSANCCHPHIQWCCKSKRLYAKIFSLQNIPYSFQM